MADDLVVDVGEFRLRGVSRKLAERLRQLEVAPVAAAVGKSGLERPVACLVTADQIILVRPRGAAAIAAAEVDRLEASAVWTKAGREVLFQATHEKDHRSVVDAIALVTGIPSPLPPPARPLPLATISDLPNGHVSESLGMVVGLSVFSRNLVADLGSDLVSAVGGPVGGIEKSLRTAVGRAQTEMQQRARELGADAVLGVRVGIESVGEKAQAALATGTAVRLGASDLPG